MLVTSLQTDFATQLYPAAYSWKSIILLYEYCVIQVCPFCWTNLVLSIFFFALICKFLKVCMNIFTSVIHAGYN